MTRGSRRSLVCHSFCFHLPCATHRASDVGDLPLTHERNYFSELFRTPACVWEVKQATKRNCMVHDWISPLVPSLPPISLMADLLNPKARSRSRMAGSYPRIVRPRITRDQT